MHLVQGFSKALIPLCKNCCSWSSRQPFAVQITFSLSENLRFFHEFFQLMKQIEVTRSQDNAPAHMLKHWLPSKMPALNHSVTHRIRHSYSYCTRINSTWLHSIRLSLGETRLCLFFTNMFVKYKKLTRRWDSERDLSLPRHCTRTRTTKYDIAHKFSHRLTLFVARHRPIRVFTVEKIQ